MELFENYLDNIDGIINKKNIGSYKKYLHDNNLLKGLNEQRSTTNLSEAGVKSLNNPSKTLVKFDHTSMSNLFGINKYSIVEPTIGNHRDFSHLEHNEYENHYAVSMFLDIKGSTELSRKYDLLQVRLIKDTILTLAIHVCSFFGGHIQRLQGDGIFVYFVKRGQHKNDAIINSLNASSMMCYFTKYVMSKLFQKVGIEPLKVRVGIDYGDDDQVLWSNYGLSMCNELTTTSLHTDLASKLQADAKSNGIMIGENIVQKLDFRESLLNYNPSDKTIFPDYNKYELKWEEYLRTFNFFKRESNGNLAIEVPHISLKCMIGENEYSINHNYPQNLFSIPKGFKIRFELRKDNLSYYKLPNEEIEWKITNTGKEAINDNSISPDIKRYNNSIEAIVDAKYLGHHDMECKIKRAHSYSTFVKLSVFVQ